MLQLFWPPWQPGPLGLESKLLFGICTLIVYFICVKFSQCYECPVLIVNLAITLQLSSFLQNTWNWPFALSNQMLYWLEQ